MHVINAPQPGSPGVPNTRRCCAWWGGSRGPPIPVHLKDSTLLRVRKTSEPLSSWRSAVSGKPVLEASLQSRRKGSMHVINAPQPASPICAAFAHFGAEPGSPAGAVWVLRLMGWSRRSNPRDLSRLPRLAVGRAVEARLQNGLVSWRQDDAVMLPIPTSEGFTTLARNYLGERFAGPQHARFFLVARDGVGAHLILFAAPCNAFHTSCTSSHWVDRFPMASRTTTCPLSTVCERNVRPVALMTSRILLLSSSEPL